MKKLSLSQSMFFGRFLYGIAFLIAFVASLFPDTLIFTILEIIMMLLATIGLLVIVRFRSEEYDEMGTMNLYRSSNFVVNVIVPLGFLLFLVSVFLHMMDIEVVLSLKQISQLVLGTVLTLSGFKFMQLEAS